MCSDEGKAIIAAELAKYRVPEWSVDVNQHCQHLQDYLKQIMETHFVVPAGGMRASYISPVVWEWRAAKLHIKAASRHRRKMWSEAQACAFRWWARGVPFSAQAVCKHQTIYQLVASAVTMVSVRIKQQVYADKHQFLQGIVGDGVQNVGQILHRVRSHGLGGKKNMVRKRPLPRLMTEDGSVAESREQRDKVWLNHFSNQECGQVMNTKEYLHREATAGAVRVDVDWKITDLPTLAETEEVVRSAPVGKAMGLDNIPGEVVRAVPARMAEILHPLVVKSLATLSQPVQWRGGILHAAWKGAGEVDQPANHRSLFVSSVLAKAYHKLMRGRGQDALHSVLHGLHLGSRRGAPIGYASMSLVAHIRRCQRHKLSYAALFIDTTAAYYRVIRQAALGPLESDENVARLLDKFGMAPADMHTILELVKSGGLMKEAGNSAAIQAACADFHRNTWCVSAFSSGDSVAMTATGSRPGESWADAIFSYIYARTMGTIIERADGEDLLTTLVVESDQQAFSADWPVEGCLVRDSTWADDSAIPVDDEKPERLAFKIKRLTSIALATLEEFGLAPNLKPGKTAILVHLCGPGSQRAKRSLVNGKKAEVLLEDLGVAVQVTPQYTHLGGVLDLRLNLKAEARRRLALLGDAFEQGRKLLFQNRTIPLATRVQLDEASVRSTLFNLSLWLPHGDSWDRLCGGYSRCLRRVLAAEINGEALYKIPIPLVHIITNSWELKYVATRSRLGLLCAMSLNGPSVLWAQLQHEKAWLQEVRSDLASLNSFDEEWPRADESWKVWEAAIRANPARFKLRVKQMLRKRHMEDVEHYKVNLVLWAMFRMAKGDDGADGARLMQWQCRKCDRSFASKGGLGAHFFKTHRRLATHRKVAAGTFCRGCGTEFWSLPRLSIHLRDTPRCVRALKQLGAVAPEIAPGLGSKRWRQLEVEQFTLAPTEQTADPHEVEAGSDWSDEAKAAYKALCFVLFDRDQWQDPEEVMKTIVEVLKEFPLFYLEEQMIVEKIRDELKEVQCGAPEELWDRHSTEQVFASFEQPLPPVAEGQRRNTDEGSLTLRGFQERVAAIQWEEIASNASRRCETPEPMSETLCIEWDVRDSVCSDVGEALTAAENLQSIIPEKLKEVWDRVLSGTVARVCAPNHFWDLPIARPFIALRADCWNYFDMLCLTCAYTDLLITGVLQATAEDDAPALSAIMLIKILRLARVCRIIRVMRFGAVRELRVIILGVLSGIRVLFWAIVLLFFTVYIIGVSARLLITDAEQFPEFSSVDASMLTFFRCVTDGCTDLAGQPLQEHLRIKYGSFFMLVYMVIFLFVVIGIFNLIMAVFLDSVVSDHATRELQELGYKYDEMEEMISNVIATLASGRRVEKKDQAKTFCSWICSLCVRPSHALKKSMRLNVHKEMNKQVAVTRDEFNRWLQYPEMQELLTFCKIETATKFDLFDVLDADLGGQLHFNELVEGLMQLRGPITKCDVISLRLMMSNLLRSVMRIVEARDTPSRVVR
ncbi:Cacna1c [Symbiodinium sp. CCMP2592]|nr:Cacna1c [Symbiodinium sp. CCMP2592]